MHPVPSPVTLDTKQCIVILTGRTNYASGVASGRPSHPIHFQFKKLREWSFPLSLRAKSELPSARFDKCAPHLTI